MPISLLRAWFECRPDCCSQYRPGTCSSARTKTSIRQEKTKELLTDGAKAQHGGLAALLPKDDAMVGLESRSVRWYQPTADADCPKIQMPTP